MKAAIATSISTTQPSKAQDTRADEVPRTQLASGSVANKRSIPTESGQADKPQRPPTVPAFKRAKPASNPAASSSAGTKKSTLQGPATVAAPSSCAQAKSQGAKTTAAVGAGLGPGAAPKAKAPRQRPKPKSLDELMAAAEKAIKDSKIDKASAPALREYFDNL